MRQRRLHGFLERRNTMPKEKVNITALPDLRVLQICRNLWAWLVKHPGKEKDEWPGWRIYRPGVFACPCCTKAGHEPSRSHNLPDQGCSKCLLKKYFRRGKKVGMGSGVYCDNYTGSPWYRWARASSLLPFRTVYAQKMVDIIDQAIKDLKSKGGENA
jgi:hypothetical protein